MITTMTAPEGKFGSNAEMITPMPAEAEPNNADSEDIDHTQVDQRRAVAAGIVNIATTRIKPTIFSPIIVITNVSRLSRNDILC
jgi:hypothetical protein